MKAWAIISGRTNYGRRQVSAELARVKPKTYLIELVAQIDGIEVVAFKIGEHDDLLKRVGTWIKRGAGSES